MFRFFIVLFLTVPLLEIFLLLQVGRQIGALWTVALVVLTAVVGVSLLRAQGLSTLHRLQAASMRGEPPAVPMIEGAFLLFAGALLLTPGFFTDAVGFALLVPPLRRYLAQQVLMRGMWVSASMPGQGHERSGPASGDTHTYDASYKRIDD